MNYLALALFSLLLVTGAEYSEEINSGYSTWIYENNQQVLEETKLSNLEEICSKIPLGKMNNGHCKVPTKDNCDTEDYSQIIDKHTQVLYPGRACDYIYIDNPDYILPIFGVLPTEIIDTLWTKEEVLSFYNSQLQEQYNEVEEPSKEDKIIGYICPRGIDHKNIDIDSVCQKHSITQNELDEIKNGTYKFTANINTNCDIGTFKDTCSSTISFSKSSYNNKQNNTLNLGWH